MDAEDNILLAFKTLELPWKDNERKVSCIPIGKYDVVKRKSPKYGNHFHVQDVPNRDMILIHSGNYISDILGCILPGRNPADINNDGYSDVTHSKQTMAELNKILPEKFKLISL
jgi:hypothetical protein